MSDPGPDARRLLAAVYDRIEDRAAAATDPRVTVGERAVLATCTVDGRRLAGVAHRPPGRVATWPASVAGLARLAVAGGEGDDGASGDGTGDVLARAVGVATLNALSAPAVDWLSGDPMAAVSPDVDVVVTVGLFRPAFRKFDDVTVRVVERDPPEPASVGAPAGVRVETYATDPAAVARAFDGAEVAFVTGSTLVYGGTDRYLAAARAAGVATTVLVGATASTLPGPAFEAGVDVLAGVRVADPAAVRAGVRAGDCGTDLHGNGLEKGYVAARATPGLAMADAGGAGDGDARPDAPADRDDASERNGRDRR